MLAQCVEPTCIAFIEMVWIESFLRHCCPRPVAIAVPILTVAGTG
jgi:hypothetical protein